MTKCRLLLLLMVASLACAPKPSPLMKPLVILTRGGCVNTTTMRANLDSALQAMKTPARYQLVDLDTLPTSDLRVGYPTPTLLVFSTCQFRLRHSLSRRDGSIRTEFRPPR